MFNLVTDVACYQRLANRCPFVKLSHWGERFRCLSPGSGAFHYAERHDCFCGENQINNDNPALECWKINARLNAEKSLSRPRCGQMNKCHQRLSIRRQGKSGVRIIGPRLISGGMFLARKAIAANHWHSPRTDGRSDGDLFKFVLEELHARIKKARPCGLAFSKMFPAITYFRTGMHYHRP